ncbi:hypothetical protein MN116_002468 [Schistosoma mekongi]|uniref:Rab-GAP TBC domain-containing protein n=1 Tax=Schistosoma mekongi TaxID=38744 RepID=A0AAE1ZK47_SCHME|nr:hypothetical protein MN116_002468 [Schistosoma mekongi]
MECEKQSELELLAKLEEQNRVLFSDAKVVPSLHTRRREGSLSSSISTGSGQDDTRSNGTSSQLNGYTTTGSSKLSNTSGVSIPLVIGWTAGAPVSSSIREQWVYVVNNWDQCSKKKSYVSNLIKKGVPDEFRPLIWQLYCGAYDSAVKKHYHNYLLVNSPVEKAIRRDIARTFPKHDLFKDENGCGQESLFRVIKAYSIHDPEVGYCQGSAFIVGLLLMQMPELNAFSVLVQLMNDYRLREMYKPSMMELGVCMYQLEQLIADNLPDLYTHFRTQSFAPSLYASAWFLTLFSTILPIPFATRVMDFYIVEGIHFIFKLALSMLRFSADNLLRCDMESMVAYLQHEGPLEWDKHSTIIFENAYSIKLNIKRMKKLEKEYMTMRSQEREEQIELRRLRTENGLLLQRLARLEEESEVMADHLVKCQLIRAQEAETTIALRCELSILRREYANLNSNSHLLTSELMNNNDYLEDDAKHLTRNQNMENSIEANDVFSTYEKTETSIVNTMPTVSASTTSSVTTTTVPINKVSVSSIPNGNHMDVNGSAQIHQSHVVNGYSHNSTLSTNHILDNNSTITSNTRNNHSSICSSPSEQQINNSYDFCTLPRSRNREHHTRYLNQTEIKSDQLLSTTINQLQTDLVNSRFNEADAKKVAHELRCKLHELEESKSDQSLRYAEQIAVLKDELFGVKLRETELINQIEEFKRRFNDLDSLWQSHIGKCKSANNDTKRSSLWIGSLNSLDSHEVNGKIKFSDRLLETRFINQISGLKQQITDLTVQQELSDRRADRLDKRVTELLESRTAFQARERELTLELKQLEQKCADIEAKRKADGVMWRSREMEFKAQLAERKQGYLQLEYQYESLLTSQRLQSKADNHELMLRKSSGDSDVILENTTSNITKSTTDNNNSSNNSYFTLCSYLKFTQPNRQISLSNSTISTPRVTTVVDTTTTTTTMKNDTYYPVKNNDNNELYSMWKDLPPAVMTESIGPLEDLCLIPDDPMITSVYLISSSSGTTTTTTSEPSTPPSLISDNQQHL